MSDWEMPRTLEIEAAYNKIKSLEADNAKLRKIIKLALEHIYNNEDGAAMHTLEGGVDE